MSMIKDKEFDVALGARIREARAAAALSQGALGEAIGVSFQQVQKYELGRDRCSVQALSRIAEALGRRPGDFFDPQPAAAPADGRVVPISAAAIRRQLGIAEQIEALTPDARRRVMDLVALLPRAEPAAPAEPAEPAEPDEPDEPADDALPAAA